MLFTLKKVLKGMFRSILSRRQALGESVLAVGYCNDAAAFNLVSIPPMGRNS